MGFQRSSVCGRPSEVRVSSIFQAYSNSFVKARPEARGIETLTEIQMFYPKNDGLLGFLFKSIV